MSLHFSNVWFLEETRTNGKQIAVENTFTHGDFVYRPAPVYPNNEPTAGQQIYPIRKTQK